jgi:phosphoribosylanthranilate isomerase
MKRVRVKICGITRPQDALAAVSAGADAIGLVFYPSSPRAVSIDAANAIVRELPPFVSKVGLFVDAAPDYLRSILSNVNLDMLQFHGTESPADCDGVARPYIKAVRVQAGVDLAEQSGKYAKAAGILFDAHVPGLAGGTGQTFDWRQVPRDLKKPVILAGGLDADNVSQAIRLVRPYAVDVSGGVESTPGIKDREKIIRFIGRVREYGNE